MDGSGRLYMDGRPVRQVIALSPWQIVGGVIVAFGALAQGALALCDFGARLGWWVLK